MLTTTQRHVLFIGDCGGQPGIPSYLPGVAQDAKNYEAAFRDDGCTVMLNKTFDEVQNHVTKFYKMLQNYSEQRCWIASRIGQFLDLSDARNISVATDFIMRKPVGIIVYSGHGKINANGKQMIKIKNQDIELGSLLRHRDSCPYAKMLVVLDCCRAERSYRERWKQYRSLDYQPAILKRMLTEAYDRKGVKKRPSMRKMTKDVLLDKLLTLEMHPCFDYSKPYDCVILFACWRGTVTNDTLSGGEWSKTLLEAYRKHLHADGIHITDLERYMKRNYKITESISGRKRKGTTSIQNKCKMLIL